MIRDERINGHTLSGCGLQEVVGEVARDSWTEPYSTGSWNQEHVDPNVPLGIEVGVLNESHRLTWRRFDDEASNPRQATSEILMADFFLR